ncbi:hypothetical protein A6302_00609 [Methylobrevis pamukkalensis]|uniref:Anti-sigma factor NepR domain-containing protein n=1 Tax=Methylobrevis pamukkalensis TaxID=1439726 RepID=A0A1E3H715_9HYPH|nr:NepR family anti-sigma factor [Methylobrevis pamukkalensis]ODN72094.1 hypothetical protein A6302_00609 [Methylobrevis pamukkalensis]
MSKFEDKGHRPGLPADAQNVIGRKLKAMYDEVVQQPVPDRFLDLLAKLDADVNAQRSKKDGE